MSVRIMFNGKTFDEVPTEDEDEGEGYQRE